MSAPTLRMHIDPRSLAHTTAALSMLPRRVAIKHTRIALNAWGGVVKKQAIAGAPRETGLMAKSFAVKVIIPDASYSVKHHGRPARCIVGIKRGVVAPYIHKGGKAKTLSLRKATKRVLGGGRVRVRRPSRYLHLVEHGHRIVRRKASGPIARFSSASRTVGRVRGKGFMAAAYAAGRTMGMAAFTNKLAAGIEQEGAALGRSA